MKEDKKMNKSLFLVIIEFSFCFFSNAFDEDLIVMEDKANFDFPSFSLVTP